jgi:glycosyltransferase involved in cell wall biosynthesis
MLREDPLISVIVPVYKVEAYLDRCVSSILRQTYGNLEILLVDDGSPDRCGLMCDEYAKEDPRVRVIHKENGGVSSARNAGIRAARGAFIGFVDSDDYIAPDMYEFLCDLAVSEKADMAICSFFTVKGDKIFTWFKNDGARKALSGAEAIGEMIARYSTVVWNRITRRAIFDEIRFDEGERYSEDVMVALKTCGRAEKIVFADCAKYYYVQHAGSRSKEIHESAIRNDLMITQKAYAYFMETFSKLSGEMINCLAWSYATNAYKLLTHGIELPDGSPLKTMICQGAMKLFDQAGGRQIKLRHRCVLVLFQRCLPLCKLLCKMARLRFFLRGAFKA